MADGIMFLIFIVFLPILAFVAMLVVFDWALVAKAILDWLDGWAVKLLDKCDKK